MAKANNIDIATVQGSGKSGRVMKEDMLRVLGGQRFDNVSLDPPASVSELPSAHSRPAAAAAPPSHRGGAIGEGAKRDSKGMSHEATASPPAGRTPPLPFPPPPPPVGPSPAGQLAAASGARLEDARLEDARLEDAYVPVRGYMRAMIKTMQAQTAVPHLVFSDEYSMDGLIALRQRLQQQQQLQQQQGSPSQQGVKLTYMPFLIKALSLALHEYPEINATFSSDQEHVIQRAAHNVGIAVDSPNGLVVPNIKHVEALSIMQIAQELQRLSELARANKLPQEDLAGGTITLSNIGAIGGTYMSPILVPGEAVIGAMGAMQKVPKYAADGSLQPHVVMNMSWAADHRLLAGATVARFSNRFKTLLEDPALMLVALR